MPIWTCLKSTFLPSMALFAAFLCGCSVEPETLDKLREVVNTVASRDAGGSVAAGSDADPASRAEATMEFVPLHPDRVDPFTFPNDAPVADVAGKTITGVAQVEVLGFAKVDEQRVFIKTKKLTKSLKVGDEIDGVKIIEINPPAVKLKMGSLVWTATMFDHAQVVAE